MTINNKRNININKDKIKINGRKDAASLSPSLETKSIKSKEIDPATNENDDDISTTASTVDESEEYNTSTDNDDAIDTSNESDEDDGFDEQGSSSDESDSEEDDDNENNEPENEEISKQRISREKELQKMREDGALDTAKLLHIDDLSSDDDDDNDITTTNTIGNVPLRWYDDYNHIGYDRNANQIIKSQKNSDGIDELIAAKDDPLYSRTIYDAYNDRKIIVSERDLEIIKRIKAGAFAHPECDANPDNIDYYSSDVMIHSLKNDLQAKSHFIPSKWEREKIAKIAKGIKEGRIKIDDDVDKIKKPQIYSLWNENNDNTMPNRSNHIAAPKMPLPGHIESYNPPDEYLFTEEEENAWKEMDPTDREISFIPRKFKTLRQVKGYNKFVMERYERCLDLYLCPRANKRRLNIDPESLVPQLPKPRELRPFPNTLALLYNGHTARVRTITVSTDGQYLASGSDDGTVRLWEIDTCRCLHIWNVGTNETIYKILWNPNPEHQMIAVACGKKVYLIATGTGSKEDQDITDALLCEPENLPNEIKNNIKIVVNETEEKIETLDENFNNETKRTVDFVRWTYSNPSNLRKIDNNNDNNSNDNNKNIYDKSWAFKKINSGIRIVLHHREEIKNISWHSKGDYLASVSPDAVTCSVLIHQLSKKKTQNPFTKNLGQVQAVAFHPTKPFFFHATQRYVRIYNLLQQIMIKKLSSGIKWISSMDIHPTGDHLIIGSYDKRICWFDLDLSSTPFKTLKYHEKAVRDVTFHKKYPLMASASDDGTIHIFHSMVYSDLSKNPLIVPLKVLRGHEITGGLGVLSLIFHPSQPWIISGGADGTIRLFQNIH